MFGFGVGMKNVYLIKTDSLGNSGCNQSSPATVTANLLPQVISPPTLVASGGTISFPATLVNGGTTTTSLCQSVVGVSEWQTDHSLLAYPNPFEQKVTIQNPNKSEIREVRIYNTIGQEVYSSESNNQIMNGNISLNLSQLDKGIFLCHIKTNQNWKIIKLVKE